jgi:hypothetical protein
VEPSLSPSLPPTQAPFGTFSDIGRTQDQEIQQLIEQFQGQKPTGLAVQGPEVLVHTALFKPAIPCRLRFGLVVAGTATASHFIRRAIGIPSLFSNTAAGTGWRNACLQRPTPSEPRSTTPSPPPTRKLARWSMSFAA